MAFDELGRTIVKRLWKLTDNDGVILEHMCICLYQKQGATGVSLFLLYNSIANRLQ